MRRAGEGGGEKSVYSRIQEQEKKAKWRRRRHVKEMVKRRSREEHEKKEGGVGIWRIRW